MIVCVCNNISESELRQAIQGGLNTMSSLRKELGVATCCGKCNGCARQVLRDTLNSLPAPTAGYTELSFHPMAA